MNEINQLEIPPTELELAELLNNENFTDAGKLILRKLIFQKEKAMAIENLLELCCKDLYSSSGKFKKSTALKLYDYVNINNIDL